MSAVAVRTVVDAVAMSTVVRTVAVLLHVEAVCWVFLLHVLWFSMLLP